MKEKKATDIIPVQETGRKIDAESSVELKDEERARARFQKAKARLENVNEWKNYAGDISATFQLIDKDKKGTKRKPAKGDYFKIDIPGPGSKAGDGYDWVQVEEIVNTSELHAESFGFRVRPTSNPDSEGEDTAHFYSEESTSSFLIEREGSKVTASIHDRNTKPNTNADHPLDKIRDTLVGAAGALSFSKIQWKKLTDGLVRQ
jgi:hypothetical protein